MVKYIIKRILSLIPVLFVISVIIFGIIHLTPGDPASVMLGPDATEDQVEELRIKMGFDRPVHELYINWATNALKGDLGESYFMNTSVTSVIMKHVPPTLSLAIFAQIITILIAIPLGIAAANRRGTFADQAIMSASLLGLSIPSFLLGLLGMLFIGVKLSLLPVAGYEPLSEGIIVHLKYLILPAASLGAIQAALIARMTRTTMLEVLNANYINAAKAKGVKRKSIIYKHALRNAFLPILTVIGQSFGLLVAGAVVTETIFNIPGLGQLVINSVERRDYTIIQGVVLFITVTYVLINLVVDIVYGLIDPRVRLDRK